MHLQEAIGHVCAGGSLSCRDAAAVMRFLMSGEASAVQMAALLVALRMKGETADEITGFAQAMRDCAAAVPTHRRPLVDTCGTGGDHSGTFNISTTAAFVVAGAGVAVAKHGNRAASSKCGSADVLEALGVDITIAPERIGRCIDEIGIGFLFARTLHTAMKHVAPVRMELKIRTVFNILGPLTNPADADGQVMGVYDRALAPVLAQALMALKGRHVFVVAGLDGLDELTLSGPSMVCEAHGNTLSQYEITPDMFGLAQADRRALAGGDARENAALLRRVLEGEPGPRRDVTLLNAAPALVAGRAAADLREAVRAATESIGSGAALKKLEALIEFSRSSV